MNILIVDPDASFRALLRPTLENAGYTLAEVSTPAQALRLLDHTALESVLARLPESPNGEAPLCSKICTDPRLLHTSLILYSATAAPDDRGRALELGADEFVGPSPSPGSILAALRHAHDNVILRDRATFYRQVFDSANDALFLFEFNANGRPGHILDVNDIACQLLGYPREELLSLAIPDLEPPEIKNGFADIADRFRVNQRLVFERTLLTKQGQRVETEISVRLFYNQTGPLAIAAARDITERKKLESQFLRAQRMEVVGTLAGGLAHDLNNILAAMLMASGLLKNKINDPHDRDVIQMIETSAQRGTGVIRQLLTFSRGLESARVRLQPRHLVEDMVQLMQETFPRHLQIIHQAPKNLWCINADATQIHQVLMNLCVNARDAMPDGGRLTLAVSNLVLEHSSTRTAPPAPPGRYVVFSVADTGHGIPKENLSRIFDPFFTTKAPDKGTGLGLSSVQSIAKNHSGYVTVDSTPGQGSTFKVYLPAANEEVSTAEANGHSPSTPVGQGQVILLVDDEDALREITRRLLEQHGYRVFTAAHGEEAVRLFVEHHDDIDLLLTDLMMPVMNGTDLIRCLQIIEPKLKVLVHCGSYDLTKRDELGKLNVTEALSKPCEATVLLQTIHRLLAPAP